MREGFRGLGRALRYFVRHAQSYMVIIVAGGLWMPLYMWMVNSDNYQSLGQAMKMTSFTTVYVVVIVVITSGLSECQSTYRLLLSMGCRRRIVFVGEAVMRVLIFAETIVYLYAVNRILGSIWSPSMYRNLLLGAMLLLEGLAQLCGALVLKYRRYAYWFIVPIMMACIICVGVVLGLGQADSWSWIIPDRWLDGWLDGWQILAAGGVVCAAGYVCSYLALRNYEVKV